MKAITLLGAGLVVTMMVGTAPANAQYYGYGYGYHGGCRPRPHHSNYGCRAHPGYLEYAPVYGGYPAYGGGEPGYEEYGPVYGGYGGYRPHHGDYGDGYGYGGF